MRLINILVIFILGEVVIYASSNNQTSVPGKKIELETPYTVVSKVHMVVMGSEIRCKVNRLE